MEKIAGKLRRLAEKLLEDSLCHRPHPPPTHTSYPTAFFFTEFILTLEREQQQQKATQVICVFSLSVIHSKPSELE